MYTICWTDNNGNDRWARCESRRELAAIIVRNALEDDDSVLIFTPEADDCTMSIEDVMAAL